MSANKPIVSHSDRFLKFPFSFLWILLISLIIFVRTIEFSPGKLDEYNILLTHKELLKDPGNLVKVVLTNPFFEKGGDFYRPLQNLSFMADAQWSGSGYAGYYITGLLLHAIGCTLLYTLLARWTRSRRTAFLLAVIYAAHPMFVQMVGWLPARGDLLIMVTGLASMLFFIRFTERPGAGWLALYLLSFTFAVFSKETAIVLPVVFYAWYFIDGKTAKISFRFFLPLLVSLLPIAAWLYTRQAVIGVSVAPGQFGIGVFLRNLQVIPELLFKFLLPLELSPMPAYSWWFVAGGLLIVAGMAWFIRSQERREMRLSLFGFLWFLLLMAPSMFYMTRYGSASYDYLEHRGYLPLAGIVITIASILNGPRIAAFRPLPMVLTAILVIFGVYSFVYLNVYAASGSFYDRAVTTNPASAIAVFNRGVVSMYEKQDFRSAMADFDQANDLLPGGYAQAWLNKGYCLEQLQDPAEALKHYRKAASMNREAFEPYLAMALLLEKHGEYSMALAAYDTVLLRVPGEALYWYRRAMLKYRVRELQAALNDFDQSISLNNRYADAFSNRGILKFEMQDYPGALADLSSAIAIDQRSAGSFLNRGRIHYFMQEYGLACQDWLAAGSLGSEEARQLWEEYCR